MQGPGQLAVRQMGEWTIEATKAYEKPFADVAVEGVFTSPGGTISVMPAFHDGGKTWRLRFNPGEAGDWTVTLRSTPPGFAGSATFHVDPRETRGFLKVTPGDGWGFAFENGDLVLPFGDTVYDIFGMAYCGGDVEGFLERRVAQGFNIIRARLTSSRFHPPEGNFEWQTREMWPWGGSSTGPMFDRFNLDWFRSIDKTMAIIDRLGMTVELIMEGWGFEYPFNHRAQFTTEWEELWMRYLIARYDAFGCVAAWTPLNEYEYYPNGDWNYKPVSDRYAIRISRWLKAIAPHGHIIAAHNGPIVPPFAQRFVSDPAAVDAIMFQSWGTRDETDGWLAAGIDDSIRVAFDGWAGGRILAEWGYERDPSYPVKLPAHLWCDRDHTRRGAWRAVTQGMGIIWGQDPSWGVFMELDKDLPGLDDLLILRRFLTDTLPFHELVPADLVRGEFKPGYRPLALRSKSGASAVVYFPAGGSASIDFTASTAEWFDPRTGTSQPAPTGTSYEAPAVNDARGYPLDYVLVLHG